MSTLRLVCVGIAATLSVALIPPTHVQAQVTLDVILSGTGTGTVTSAPAGINCPGACTQGYAIGTMVTLTATPNADSTFSGWNIGGCSGTTTPCTFDLEFSGPITVAFELSEILAPPPPGPMRITQSATNDTAPTWNPIPGNTTIAYARAQTQTLSGEPLDLGRVESDGTIEGFFVVGSTEGGIARYHSWVGSTGTIITNRRFGEHDYRTVGVNVGVAPFPQTPLLTIDTNDSGEGISISRDGSTALWRIETADGNASLRTASFFSLSGQNAATHGTVVFGPMNAGLVGVAGFALTTDGSQFVIAEPSGNTYDLFLRNTNDGTLIRQLTNGGLEDNATIMHPDVSPDGTRVAFGHRGSGELEHIYIVNIDGTEITQVTDGSGNETEPSWSPDGTQLVFQRFDTGLPGSEPDNWNLYVTDAPEAKLPEMEPEDLPDFSGTITKFKHKIKDNGDQLTVKARIDNIGSASPENDITVTLHLSQDAILDADDPILGDELATPQITVIEASQLQAGQSTNVKFKITDQPTLNEQFIILSIDDTNTVTESDEKNNARVQMIGGRGCSADTIVAEKEPNSIETPQTIGRLKQSECVTFEGNLSDNADADSIRLTIKGNQMLEVRPSGGDELFDETLMMRLFVDGQEVECGTSTPCDLFVNMTDPDNQPVLELRLGPGTQEGEDPSSYTINVFSVTEFSE